MSSPSPSADDDAKKKSSLTASATGVLDVASTSLDVDTRRADVAVPRADVLLNADADDATCDEGATKPLAELTSSKRQKLWKRSADLAIIAN